MGEQGEGTRPNFKLEPSSKVSVGPEGRLSSRLKRETIETVGTSKKRNWRLRLASTAAGAALLAAAGLGINKTIEENTNTPDFGEPLSDHSLVVKLNNITNEAGENLPPTFREDPESESKELTREELKERGIDVLDGNITVREVRGATYSGNPQTSGGSLKEILSNENFDMRNTGFITDKKSGVNFGVWGEIVITDPNTGEDKPTGVFLSKNFYSEPEQIPSTSQPTE